MLIDRNLADADHGDLGRSQLTLPGKPRALNRPKFCELASANGEAKRGGPSKVKIANLLYFWGFPLASQQREAADYRTGAIIIQDAPPKNPVAALRASVSSSRAEWFTRQTACTPAAAVASIVAHTSE
jgi:hypothetical protein